MYVLYFLIVIFLSGCNPFSGYLPDAETLQTRHWAKSKPQPMQLIYCYKFLGGDQCYNTPIKGKEHLLMGQHSLAVVEPKKPLWERMNLHPLIGVDADTVRSEMALKPAEKIYYYEPVAP